MSEPSPLTYRDAGVDIDAGDELVERIKPYARRTLRPGVLAGIGGFGALFELPKGYKEPVLVSGTDGVGTKLKLAFELGLHDTIGVDLVAMSVNDILTLGAEPLYFLDYYACGKLDVATASAVVKGIALGCERAGCVYAPGEYDVAGFAVGVVEKSRIIDGSTIVAGDVVLGLASSGAHSNGYSLIRKIVARSGMEHSIAAECADASNAAASQQTLAELLLAPTRIYVRPVLELLKQVSIKGIAHITGGGLVENVPRVLAEDLTARIDRKAWAMPPLFKWLQSHGNVADEEMFRVFNCGIGMVLIVDQKLADRAVALLTQSGETVSRIGVVDKRGNGEPQTIIA
jgi:phosphoribosylformylglycinamidine cyclo-ligase